VPELSRGTNKSVSWPRLSWIGSSSLMNRLDLNQKHPELAKHALSPCPTNLTSLDGCKFATMLTNHL
jgi:hypothetical protein